MKKWQWAVRGVAFGLLFFTAITFVTMLLWNKLAAAIFGLPILSFFQTLGLMVLGRLLTGGFGPRGRWRPAWRGGHYMRQRWQNMTPEEREQVMRYRSRHGCGPWSETEQEMPAETQNPTA